MSNKQPQKVAYENNERRADSVFGIRVKAGKRRTYFFDVRATRGNDYFLTITESRKRFDSDGYDRHKIFLYKEDFNKFIKGLNETVDHVKTVLMPDFDFDAFNHDTPYEEDMPQPSVPENDVEPNNDQPSSDADLSGDNGANEEVDKW